MHKKLTETKTINISGTSKMGRPAQQLLTQYMYQKGKEFLGAALLLKQKGSFTHASTHLICLAVELIFKSQLLFKDYQRFKPLLPKKNVFGHNLLALAQAWKTELNQNRINSKFIEELEILNQLYNSQGLRYGSITDIFISSDSVKTKETLKQLKRIIIKTDNKIIIH